jgi:uncharacterized repeat protein (TIGR01451 family)
MRRWLSTIRGFAVVLLSTAIVFVAAVSSVMAQEADVGVAKSGPATAAPDSDVAYSVTVFNLGLDAAVDVTVTDPIPAGMTFVSASQISGPAFSCSTPTVGSGGTIACTLSMMPSGSSADFTFTLRIPAGTPNGVTFTNTASVSQSTFDPNDENNSSAAGTSTPPPPTADISVAKSGPASAGPDTDVTFTITVVNAGPDAATNVTLTDTLPGGMTFVSVSQGSGPAMSCVTPAVGSSGTITCSAATFLAGATASFTLIGHVPPGTSSGTVFMNVAAVSASSVDPNDENDSASSSLSLSAVDVAATKSGPGTVNAGATVAYTITISNAGPDNAQDVVLTDGLPPGTTFVSLTQENGPTASCVTPSAGAGGTVTCAFNTLTAGASAQFTLTLNVGSAVTIVNTAVVATSSFDVNASNNNSSVTTAVAQSANVGVAKSGPAVVTEGQPVTYVLTVTNAGPSGATSVTLTDTVPAGMTFVSVQQTSGPTFACSTPAVGAGGTISCSTALLPAGSAATLSVVLQLTAPVENGASVSNTANVTAATPDPNAANNASTVTSTTAQAPVAIPLLSPSALALLALTLAALGLRARARRMA